MNGNRLCSLQYGCLPEKVTGRGDAGCLIYFFRVPINENFSNFWVINGNAAAGLKPVCIHPSAEGKIMTWSA